MLFSPISQPLALGVNAEAGILLDATTGTVLFEQEADKKLAPASLTKIMTEVLALEAIRQGIIGEDSVVVVSERAWRTGGSTMFLNQGDRVPFSEIIKGAAVVSGNDACIVIAETIDGSVEAFVERMNRRAEELGLQGSHFVNPHGLDAPDHYTTARDVAKLSFYAMNNVPELLDYTSIKELTYAGITQRNRNGLLWTYEGVDGIKTGMTNNAGYNLCATAKRGNSRFIAVVMGADSAQAREAEAAKLLNYAFSNFETATLAQKGEEMTTVAVKRGKADQLTLVAQEPAVATVEKAQRDNVKSNIELPERIVAPIEKGQQLGTVHFMVGERELAAVPLVAKEDIPRAGLLKIIRQTILDFLSRLFSLIGIGGGS